MNRKFLVVGDSPAPGGAVLPYGGPEFLVMGHRVALIGGRAYCEGCNSIGLIAKAGGDYRPGFYGAQIALAGDVVVCRCPHPQPILPVRDSNSWCDDRNTLLDQTELTPEFLVPGRLVAYPNGVLAAQKRVAEDFQHAPEHEPTAQTICPNVTNKEFADAVLQQRDEAMMLVVERLDELRAWNRPAQKRVRIWFGDASEDIRTYLQKGLGRCNDVLGKLKAANFIRYAEGLNKQLGCTFPSNADKGTSAAVCKPDVATRTIAIAPAFCELPKNKKIHGTSVVLLGDTQILTLVHEVTHFNDTFGSLDTWYGSRNSLDHVAPSNSAALLVNADSLASYIIGVDETTR